MFRAMRRKRQELPETETVAMLESCTSGVLAVKVMTTIPIRSL
jgi:hypothetical protein